MRILITGITGFLGTQLTKDLLNQGHFVSGTAHSEESAKRFEREYPNVSIYVVDIYSDKQLIKSIVQRHNIDSIIHTAAMKHIGLCENNPLRCIQTNVIGSVNILDVALDCDVYNALAVSTDKSINPTGVYGNSKMLMESAFLQAGYSIIRGVNFFFSTGSVLDIWDAQRKQGKPLGLNPVNTLRYFISVEDMSARIIAGLCDYGVIPTGKTLEVRLHDLYEAYSKYHNYYEKVEYVTIESEKLTEELPVGAFSEPTTVEDLIKLFQEYYDN